MITYFIYRFFPVRSEIGHAGALDTHGTAVDVDAAEVCSKSPIAEILGDQRLTISQVFVVLQCFLQYLQWKDTFYWVSLKRDAYCKLIKERASEILAMIETFEGDPSGLENGSDFAVFRHRCQSKTFWRPSPGALVSEGMFARILQIMFF